MSLYLRYTRNSFVAVPKLLAVKIGIASAAVYYMKEQGIWRPSDESIKTLDKMKLTVQPYVETVKKQIPFEAPTLPEAENLSSIVKQSWNAGVIATFAFLANLPNKMGEWKDTGMKSIMESPDMKKLLDSFSSKTEQQSK
ncbi:unnamed protein product [Callosobruchus maculatus]|uniref:MICOS complex subunit MIC13 n=1 Tax=Callosobruchus maculatus TaxID=64391 RepID=A0A653BGM4_CALMS|nr:unnamed protein product [Callosobruchus maculatus]